MWILYNVHRSWRSQATTESYLFVSTSIQRSQSSSSSAAAAAAAAAASDGDVEAELIAGHYVIEPCGAADKSKLTHFSSVDFR